MASLADYTAGKLHGRWIDASQDVEGIRADIAAMLKESTEPIAEEWAIHDYEGFGCLRLSEYEDIEMVASVAQLIEEHGEVFAGLVNHLGGLEYLDDARRTMEEGYCGEFDSVEDYARESVEDAYADVLEKLPDFIRYNIDWEAIGRDFELGGDIFTIEIDYRVHVFYGNV
ncbi:MAG TPA: antirestriction protein ArdA [Tepidisphaeraceae bacterium]|nr:antirestriction protein ArdA [Tepidisphaeraceae bacterium]